MKRSLLSLSAAAVVAIAATSLASMPGRAEIVYPWCSVVSAGQSGMPSCRFATLEQCTAFISGLGGFCQQNAITAQAQAPKRGARYP